MLKLLKKIIPAIILFVLLSSFVTPLIAQETEEVLVPPPPPVDSGATSREELERKIQIQNQELEKLNRELEETQNKLKTTKDERLTLQKQLNTIKNDIYELNLNIKADKISIEKLGLEVESLNYDIRDTELSMEDKREAVVEVLRRMQRNSRANFIAILLRGDTLADSIFQIQSLADTSSQLSLDIAALENLREEKVSKVETISNKKNEIGLRKKNLENRKIIVEDQENDKEVLISQTKNKESVYSQQLKELEKRQEEIAAEIEKIEKELREQIDPNLLPIPRPGVLAWPVEQVRITQKYGVTEFARRNYRGQHHNGLDLGGPIGTPILAAEEGVVINVGDQDKYRGCRGGAYGKFMVIKHKNGLTTLYAHLSRYIVSIDQEVKAGEIIGYMGKSGWATGPHLHFTVFASNTLTPASPGFPEGTKASRVCGPMPVGGDLDPEQYL